MIKIKKICIGNWDLIIEGKMFSDKGLFIGISSAIS